jgi:hypothetical protein
MGQRKFDSKEKGLINSTIEQLRTSKVVGRNERLIAAELLQELLEATPSRGRPSKLSAAKRLTAGQAFFSFHEARVLDGKSYAAALNQVAEDGHVSEKAIEAELAKMKKSGELQRTNFTQEEWRAFFSFSEVLKKNPEDLAVDVNLRAACFEGMSHVLSEAIEPAQRAVFVASDRGRLLEAQCLEHAVVAILSREFTVNRRKELRDNARAIAMLFVRAKLLEIGI